MTLRLSVRHIRLLAGFAAVLTLVLVGLGGFVRGTGAGLSCPDWPLCHGRLVPHHFGDGIAQEVGHRYLASIVSCLILGLATLGFFNRKRFPLFWRSGRVLLLLLAIQIVLGGLTVLLQLNPFIVTGHLAAGTLVFQILALAALDRPYPKTRITSEMRSIQRPAQKPARFLAILTLGLSAAVFAQMVLGGFVGSSGASLACPNIPSCYGGKPDQMWAGPQYIQMIHRVFAFAILVGMIFLLVSSKRLSGGILKSRGHLYGMATMIAVQVGLGFSNVYFRVPVALAVAHLVVAQLILLGLLRFYKRLQPEQSVFVEDPIFRKDDLDFHEYASAKRRFVANIH